MIAPVDPFIEAFAEAGADIITVHPEAGPAPPPHDPDDQGARQARRRLAQPGDARQGARLCARGDRPRPGDERQSGLRRAELHRRPAQEDRGDQEADRRDRPGDRPRGGRRHRPGQCAARDRGRRRRARRRHRDLPRRARTPMPTISGACAGEPPRKGGERNGRGRDRAGQEADPRRRRPRPLLVRAARTTGSTASPGGRRSTPCACAAACR